MKTPMTSGWLISLATCVSISISVISCSFPQRQGDISDTKQCLSVYDKGDEWRLYCLRDIVMDKNQRKGERGRAFSELIDAWNHRDGAGGFALSDIFLDILDSDHTFFFSHMKDYPNEFNAWLPEVGDLSFVGLEYFVLEERRQKLISLLETIPDGNKDVDSMRKRLLEVLRGIKPRQID